MKSKIKISTYTQYWDFHREHHYMFYLKNKLVGSYYISDDGDDFTVCALYIQEDFRGKGYSKILIKHAIDNYKELYLQVHVDNKIAINLYKKYGFEFTENNKNPRYHWMRNFNND